MTIIGFIRHGVTDWNLERRAQGHTDIPLNAEGVRQAELLAKRMRSETWDAVYSSDLIRAYETARIAISGIGSGLRIETDLRLRELYLGQIEGTTEEERIRRWGEEWSKLDLEIESREAVADRGAAAAEEIARRHEGKRILLVSHAGLIGHTIRRLAPGVHTDPFLHNTSLTVIRKTNAGWECLEYNCIRHLEEPASDDEAAG